MYFISFVGVVVVSGLMLLCGIGGNVVWFIDMPSFVLILIFDVTMLLSSGLLKDFNNAFRFVVKKDTEEAVTEIKRAVEAVALTRKVTLAAGGFTVFFQLVLIMGGLDDPALLGPHLAICILSVLYALAIVLILLPLESRLRLKLLRLKLQNLLQSPEQS